MAEDKLTMEQHFEEIEKLIEKLEDKDISMEESFACYKDGIQHLATCNEMMDAVEKKVMELNQNGNLVEFKED